MLHRYKDMGPQIYWGHDLDLLGLREVIGHVTIGLCVSTFLLVVNDDKTPILHGYGDTGLKKFWGHEFDLLGSRDAIVHVTIGLGICGFLLVVHWNQRLCCTVTEILSPKDNVVMNLTFWGHVTSSTT